MEDENQELIQFTEELHNLADTSLQNVLWDKRSIYKIPASVTALNRIAYMPQTVSFGPYHHGEDHLKPMEEHKQRALRYYLNRSGRRLQEVVESLNEEIQVLKDSYDMLGESWKDDKKKFLRLMILDGCFMLEIIRLATHSLDGYAANDPIFSSHGRLYIAPSIRRDMFLLEINCQCLFFTSWLLLKVTEHRYIHLLFDIVLVVLFTICQYENFYFRTGRRVCQRARAQFLLPQRTRLKAG
jgi:hypothetical protein